MPITYIIDVCVRVFHNDICKFSTFNNSVLYYSISKKVLCIKEKAPLSRGAFSQYKGEQK